MFVLLFQLLAERLRGVTAKGDSRPLFAVATANRLMGTVESSAVSTAPRGWHSGLHFAVAGTVPAYTAASTHTVS